MVLKSDEISNQLLHYQFSALAIAWGFWEGPEYFHLFWEGQQPTLNYLKKTKRECGGPQTDVVI
jgi:hypothetical protein